MYKLYWSMGSASMLPHGVLEELGLAYELQLVDTGKGQHREAAYLAINPNGKVPALSLPDGRVITECAAIAMYLADQKPSAGLAPSLDNPLRGAYYQWMAFLTNSLQTAAMRFYYPERISTDPRAVGAIADQAKGDVAEFWGRIEAHLQLKGPYLLGASFTVADIFLHMLSLWRECCPDLCNRFPSVKKLANLVGARPAIARVLKANLM